jgi:hypothetical protein
MRFRHTTRGGPYVRVADPAWLQPLDPRFAQERGGRWNPPDSFAVVYLCAGPEVARAVVVRRFEGLPYGIVDLLPSRGPALIETDVPAGRLVDVVGDAGCRAAGLPTTYPFDGRGRRITWERTQPVGAAAWAQGERGVACRSATIAKRERGEELAWFVRRSKDRLRVTRRRGFEDWF